MYIVGVISNVYYQKLLCMTENLHEALDVYFKNLVGVYWTSSRYKDHIESEVIFFDAHESALTTNLFDLYLSICPQFNLLLNYKTGSMLIKNTTNLVKINDIYFPKLLKKCRNYFEKFREEHPYVSKWYRCSPSYDDMFENIPILSIIEETKQEIKEKDLPPSYKENVS